MTKLEGYARELRYELNMAEYTRSSLTEAGDRGLQTLPHGTVGDPRRIVRRLSDRQLESPILRHTNLPLIRVNQSAAFVLPAAVRRFVRMFVEPRPTRMALLAGSTYAVLSRVVRARGVDEDEGVS